MVTNPHELQESKSTKTSFRKPWHRLDQESEIQFAAFRFYAELEPAYRDFKFVAAKFQVGDFKFSAKKILDISTQHNWAKRIAAYDAFRVGDNKPVLSEELALQQTRQRKIVSRILEGCEKWIEQYDFTKLGPYSFARLLEAAKSLGELQNMQVDTADKQMAFTKKWEDKLQQMDPRQLRALTEVVDVDIFDEHGQ